MHKRQSWTRAIHSLRSAVLDRLEDDDLAYSPGGANQSWAGLLIDLAILQESYVESMESHSHQLPVPGAPTGGVSVEGLRARFADQDEKLDSLFPEWSDADYETTIKRSDGFAVTRDDQLEVYIQAMLIFLSKAAVYLRAMGRQLPESLERWIA